LLVAVQDRELGCSIRMSTEIMIVVAPVPGEKQEEKFPGALDVVEEVIGCEAAGAAIAHLHARDRNLLQSVDPALFAQQVRAIRDSCPIVIEGSTGGAPEHTLDQRCATFTVAEVEMGSLNLGSINMFDGVYQNRYEDICFYARKLRAAGITPIMPVFDLSHLINYQRLLEDGELALPYVFEFVFDVPYALPYSDRYLKLFVDHLPPGAIWFCVRHHQRGAADLRKVIELGGHLRVGYEDSPFLSNGRRARSNTELVDDAVEQVGKAGRTVVRADRAREIIGLKPLLVDQNA
jgi:3-keto-5-aminohexanoate cleavage enzyme